MWGLTPDEASPEAVAALADGLTLNMGDDEVEPYTVAEAAVFALGPKLIHHGDPAIAMGVLRPQNDSERPRAAASAN